MTAPVAIGGFAEVAARISAIQATLAQITTPVQPAATSATQFSAALAGATSAASGSAFGSVPVSGAGGVTGDAVVAGAKKYLGVPYVWGGESMQGIDCSGLVQATYKDLGIDLPRVAADQAKMGTPVASLAQAQPGDLLTFGDPAYHIAIYLGNNKLIESPEPGKTVHITDVYQTPTSIRRIVPNAGATAIPAAPGVGALTGTAGVGGVSGAGTTGGGLSAGQLTAAGLSPAVASFATQFSAAEARYHLPTGLLAAVAQQESGGNPRAVSPAGAQGLMQLMPATAAGLHVNAFDSGQAIDAAAQILSGHLRDYGGSVPLSLAAYNAGAGAVAKYGGIPPYDETQNYVRSITAMLSKLPGGRA